MEKICFPVRKLIVPKDQNCEKNWEMFHSTWHNDIVQSETTLKKHNPYPTPIPPPENFTDRIILLVIVKLCIFLFQDPREKLILSLKKEIKVLRNENHYLRQQVGFLEGHMED